MGECTPMAALVGAAAEGEIAMIGKQAMAALVVLVAIGSSIQPVMAQEATPPEDTAPTVGFDPDPGYTDDGPTVILDDQGAVDAWLDSLAEATGATVEEARFRSKLQGVVGLLSAQLQKEYGSTFAGIWIETSPPFAVNVAFSEDSRQRLDEIASRFEYPDLLRGYDSEFSLSELLNVYDSLDSALPPALVGEADDTFAWVDVVGNVVRVRHPDKAVGDVLADAFPPGSIEFQVGSDYVVDEVTAVGGMKTSPSPCTTGFIVRKNSSYEAGITTAAHCTNVTGIVGASVPLGPRLRTRYNEDDPDVDTQWLGLAERDWVPTNRIRWNSQGSTLAIKGRTSYGSINVGDYLCKYGYKTGNTCGFVLAIACCSAGHRFVESSMHTEGGDSGSPVYEFVEPFFYAVGIHKGRTSSTALFGAVSFFEQRWGISVATSSLPAPAYDWFLRNSNSQGTATSVWEWAESGSTPVAGRWISSNSDKSQPGFFRLGVWDLEGKSRFSYGASTDLPVVGDWDSDDIDEVGVFRSSSAVFYRRGSSSIAYGNPGDLPIAGDWDGDGDDEVGVYRPSQARFYLRNSNGTTSTYYYGAYGDLPVVGDWDDDGIDEIGVFRPSTGQWFLQGYSGFYYGNPTDTPLPGDWDGDGRDTPGVVR